MEAWHLADIVAPGNSDHLLFGEDQTWTPNNPFGTYSPLPSSPYPVYNGTQSFYVTYSEIDPNNTYPDFTIHAEVNCYIQMPNSSQQLSTTTYHPFNISEGNLNSAGTGWFFQKTFSCLVLDNSGLSPIIP
ncbi:MAG: hypothetical protein ACI8YQ_000913 [Polaribacter sp.]|jgi:hypothetical protein